VPSRMDAGSALAAERESSSQAGAIAVRTITDVLRRRMYVIRFEGGPLGTRENTADRRVWKSAAKTEELIHLEIPDGLTASYERVGAPIGRVVTFRYVGP
jgi:hypothetical protein